MIMRSLKLVLELDVSQETLELLCEVLKELVPPLAGSPIMGFLSTFVKVGFNLKFKSSEHLP